MSFFFAARGTASILIWRRSGTIIAVIFNQRMNLKDVVPDGAGGYDYYQTLTKKVVNEAADRVSF